MQTLDSEVVGITFVLQGAQRALALLQLRGYPVSTGAVPTDAQAAQLWDWAQAHHEGRFVAETSLGTSGQRKTQG